METEEEATDDEAPEAVTEDKMMAEASDDITKEKEAPDATITTAKEEASKEKEQVASDAAMSQRISEMSANRGRRNDTVCPDREDNDSIEEVANSAWDRQSQPTETSQRKKKQIILTGNESIVTALLRHPSCTPTLFMVPRQPSSLSPGRRRHIIVIHRYYHQFRRCEPSTSPAWARILPSQPGRHII